MSKLLRFLRLYHVLLFITFFLPFMTVTCFGPSAEEREAQRIADSARMADSLKTIDSIQHSDSTIIIDSIKGYRDKNNYTLQTTINKNSTKIDSLKTDSTCKHNSISDENTLLNRFADILFGKNDKYTGFGIVYLGLVSVRDFIGIFNAFILIILSTILVLKKKSINFKRILYIDSIGFLFLSISINTQLLWGFWICYIFWIGLIILDLVTIKTNKKSAANNGS